MNESDMKDALLLRNLKDAGCNAAMQKQFLAYEREGKSWAQRHLLLRQRNLLLRALHENQERIESLDFLLHSIEQKEKDAEQTEYTGK